MGKATETESQIQSVIKFTSRRIVYREDDLAIPNDEPLLIIDSGCDQSIITNNDFSITLNTGVYFSVNGALAGQMQSNDLLEVVDGYTLASVCS